MFGFAAMFLLGFSIRLSSHVEPGLYPSLGGVAFEFSSDGASMHAENTGNRRLGVAGQKERFNLVPLHQGELIKLFCHVVITKVVFRLHPPGALFVSATPTLHYALGGFYPCCTFQLHLHNFKFV